MPLPLINTGTSKAASGNLQSVPELSRVMFPSWMTDKYPEMRQAQESINEWSSKVADALSRVSTKGAGAVSSTSDGALSTTEPSADYAALATSISDLKALVSTATATASAASSAASSASTTATAAAASAASAVVSVAKEVADRKSSVTTLQSAIDTLSSAVSRLSAPSQVSGITGRAMEAYSAVTFDDEGLLQFANPGDMVAGVTIENYSKGVTASAILDGTLYDSSWGWIAGREIFLASNGQLTQAVPGAGWVQKIALAKSSKRIQIFVEPKALRFEGLWQLVAGL